MKKIKKLTKIFPLFLILFSVSSCNINDYLDIGDDIASKIFPNVWDFLVQFSAFVIMVILITVFAYKPIKKFIKKRQELLDEEVNETKKRNEEAKANLLVSQKEIAFTHEKASKIIENATKEGNERKQEIILQANKEAENKIKEADEIIKKNQAEAKNEIKNELSDIAIDLSSKILEREVNEGDNKKLIDDFVNKMK